MYSALTPRETSRILSNAGRSVAAAPSVKRSRMSDLVSDRRTPLNFSHSPQLFRYLNFPSLLPPGQVDLGS